MPGLVLGSGDMAQLVNCSQSLESIAETTGTRYVVVHVSNLNMQGFRQDNQKFKTILPM